MQADKHAIRVEPSSEAEKLCGRCGSTAVAQGGFCSACQEFCCALSARRVKCSAGLAGPGQDWSVVVSEEGKLRGHRGCP